MPGLRAWAQHSAVLHELRALRQVTSCVFEGHQDFKGFFSRSIFGFSLIAYLIFLIAYLDLVFLS